MGVSLTVFHAWINGSAPGGIRGLQAVVCVGVKLKIGGLTHEQTTDGSSLMGGESGLNLLRVSSLSI
jgi:hypothetical protein